MSASSPLFDLDFFLARVPSTLGIMLRGIGGKNKCGDEKKESRKPRASVAQSVERETLIPTRICVPSQGCGFDPRRELVVTFFYHFASPEVQEMRSLSPKDRNRGRKHGIPFFSLPPPSVSFKMHSFCEEYMWDKRPIL
jgi:hypothetical protein